ncbi:MAG: hypothetical protein JW939_09265 [Candidatus Thermoplasmatota archaeon]|nr:hypothetical protein [Candidatus Thermoplasmatota archaeon]
MPLPIPDNDGYRIPKEEVVISVVRAILGEAMTIRSQTLFHRLVMTKLKEQDGGRFKLSPRRLRRISAKLDDVYLVIHCREGGSRSRRTRCPVCGTSMQDIKNSTLYGWTVSTGKFCPVCHYWTGTRERIPTRYVFTIEKEKYTGDTINGREPE